ncbi:MAG TPA: class I SAM-dependent methyltransferase [Gaiellaceae bacterium]
MQQGDAIGQLFLDYLEGLEPWEIVERDDGLVMTEGPPSVYFAPFRRWLASERRAMRFVRGRVLDVGCGPGRAALHLQELGREVVAIDVSPLTVEVARRRGVRDARVLGLDEVAEPLGTFDTILMLGNNFGLFQSRARAHRLLRRLHRLTSDRGRIVAQSADWSETEDPVHKANHRRNRKLGRMPGQNRLRVRHRLLATPWFDYLLATPEEMAELAEGAGWRLDRTLEEPDPRISLYVGVLEKA